MSVVQNTNEKRNWYLPGIFGGLMITGKHLVKNLLRPSQMPTLNYPEEKYEYGPRFKGNHVLTVKKDGSLRCTACMLCATNCPAECIKIVAAESDDPAVEKFPINYEIDVLRCVFLRFLRRGLPRRCDSYGSGMADSWSPRFKVHLRYQPISLSSSVEGWHPYSRRRSRTP